MRLPLESTARSQRMVCDATPLSQMTADVVARETFAADPPWLKVWSVCVAMCLAGLCSRTLTADPTPPNAATDTAAALSSQPEQTQTEQTQTGASAQPSNRSQPDPVEVTRQAVEAAIRNLNSDRIAVRRAAEQSLRQLGPAALPWLPPRSRVRGPAVRDVIDRLRVELELQQATASLDASKFTLRGTRTLGDWCAAISISTGNRIDTSRLAPARLAIEYRFDSGEVAFWAAIHELELAANIVARMNADADCVDLLPMPVELDLSTTVSVDGPFRTKIQRVAWIGPTVQRQLLSVSLRIDIEPRLQPLKLRIPPNAVRVTAGSELCPPFDPDQQLSLLFAEGVRSVACELRFQVPATARQAAAVQVSANLNCVVLADVGEVRFGPLKNLLGPQPPAAQRRGAVNTTLLGLERTTTENDGDNWRFSIDWYYDDRNADVESHETIRLTSQPFFLHPQLGAYPFAAHAPARVAQPEPARQPELARLLSANHRSRIEQQECAYQHACVTGEFRGLPAAFLEADLVCSGPSLVTDRAFKVTPIDAPIPAPPKPQD